MSAKDKNISGKANSLINESSLYLRQHAHNPVNWHPWGEEALEKAKQENKPLLISIGYSSCHWCHVMEHESFSDQEVADFMNRHFVNIKIDREERPDLDQLYMEAVQLLQGQGGWPLNCFALPDGRPFWGATYFPKAQWLEVMDQIATLYLSEPDTLKEQAERISTGINQMNLSFEPLQKDEIEKYTPENLFANIASSFDGEFGGFKGAPKFPMPSVYRFLLHYHHVSGESKALDQVVLTLKNMAAGGIYDQVGGGFARYSTDRYWKVPHFEKMLYDNAQLIKLYCEAWMVSKQESLLETAIETIDFLERETGSPETGFAASIDADSPEGEGSFYTFSLDELNMLLGDDAPLFIAYWKAGREGKWENGKNILLAPVDQENFLEENKLDKTIFNKKLKKAKSVLLAYRNKRPAPAIDPKIITSWNGMMVQAYVSLYRASSNKKYLESARQLADFLLAKLTDDRGGLLHVADTRNLIPGFLEDYASVILALLELHSASLEEEWAMKARELADIALEQFYKQESGLFDFTGSTHEKAFAKRQEIHDNVIPSSNSIMFECMLALGHIFENDTFHENARRAILGMAENILKHPSAFSNWARLFLMLRYPYHTLVIAGNQAGSHLNEILPQFLPQTLVAGESNQSRLPVLKNRFKPDETMIYVCSGKECYPPVTTVTEALEKAAR